MALPYYDLAAMPYNNPAALVATHVAGYQYIAKRDDECNLERGDMLCATPRYHGWLIGFNLRTLKPGAFPSNYVHPLGRAGDAFLRERRLEALRKQPPQLQETCRIQVAAAAALLTVLVAWLLSHMMAWYIERFSSVMCGVIDCHYDPWA